MTHGLRSCALAAGIPGNVWGREPKDWVRKRESISTDISKPVIEVKEPLSRLTLPTSLLATHIYRDPFITWPGNVSARSNLTR